MQIDWSIAGPILAVVSALIGAGIGWGKVGAAIARLEAVAMKIEHVTTDVTVLKAHDTATQQEVVTLRAKTAQHDVEIATLKAQLIALATQ